MTDEPNPDSRPDRDAIIGVVFRRSIWIGGLGGVAVGGILLARSLMGPGVTREVDETAVEPPRVDLEPAPEVTDSVMPFTDMAEAWGVDFERDDGARGGISSCCCSTHRCHVREAEAEAGDEAPRRA